MTGEVTINGKDAFQRYGINLEDGALSALMAPSAMKALIESESRLRHGKTVIVKEPKYESRELTLPFHLIAKSRDEFFRKYGLFCDEVLAKGELRIKTKYQPDVVCIALYISLARSSASSPKNWRCSP